MGIVKSEQDKGLTIERKIMMMMMMRMTIMMMIMQVKFI